MLSAAVVGATACGIGQTLDDPEDLALALFELSREDDPAAERVDALFGAHEDERERAALLDAIAELRAAGKVEIVESYAMDPLARASFDLEGTLAGGGSARYSVQVDTSEAPGAIVWFSGPGVEWPEQGRAGPGLSTSAPPGREDGG